MTKLDTNLDACQLSGEILIRLRKIIREGLRTAYGKTWNEAGIPGDIREFLTQRQAREASINWNLSDSVDVLDFAGYLNLYDIISATPNLLERFLPLAPDAHVLRIRFLELDTILNRIGYCRPISEADVGLLVSFEDRLKKSTATVPAVVEDGAARPAPRPSRSAPPAPEPPKAVAPKTPPPPEVNADKPAAAEAEPEPAPDTKPPIAQPTPQPPAPLPVPDEAPAVEPQRTPLQGAGLVGPQELETALKRGENKTVLTALYQEVTSLADGLWNGSVTSLQARTWENVRESQWYREGFAKLGLKPISDFFGLFDTAKEKMLAGTSRNELQEFLKEHSFVQVLLALKELFRKHMRS
jgi:hypothetical protein